MLLKTNTLKFTGMMLFGGKQKQKTEREKS